MLDIKKPIPVVEFPTNRLVVGNPSLEPMVYLDDDFLCDSMYNHWVEDEGRPVPGSSPSIMARETVAKMLKEAEAKLPETKYVDRYIEKEITADIVLRSMMHTDLLLFSRLCMIISERRKQLRILIRLMRRSMRSHCCVCPSLHTMCCSHRFITPVVRLT